MRLRGNIKLAFGLTIVLLVTLGASIHFNTQAVLTALEAHSHFRSRGMALRDLTVLVQSAEQAHNSYLLTGMPQFLAEFDRISTRIPGAVAQLRNASEYDADMKTSASTFAALVEYDFTDMRQTLALEASGQHVGALNVLRSDGHRVMRGELGRHISGMVGTARAASEAHRTRALDGLQQAEWWSAFLTIASVFSVLLSAQLVLEDRRNRRRLNNELRQAVDEAHRLAQAKTEFLARMSHEIRTPLNGVLGMTQLLRDTPMNEEQQEMMRVITGSGEALVHVIDDILDFSKIEAGRLHLEKVGFLLSDSVQQWAAIVRQHSTVKRQTLRVELDADMPQALRGDQRRIGQVVLNLLSNATKFTPPDGGITLRARCEHLSVENGAPIARLRIEVRDTGIGIDADTQKRLFVPFAQADSSTSRRYGGTGLGLVIARRLVDVMGGEMGLDSEAGKGSTFWFSLPLTVVPAAAVAQAQAIAAIDPNVDYSQRVLVAEDDAVSRTVVAKHLQTLGFTCDVVTNGREAVEALSQHHYGLVLMDCQMPEMDGYTATRAIRVNEQERHAGRIPIIALTANAILGEQQRCTDAGMDGYLTKPLDRRHLADALRRLHQPRV